MYLVAKEIKAAKLTLALVIAALAAAPAASAQGLMEYGGLMAMPKGIPGGDTIKNLTRGYSSAIPNALPGQAEAPSVPAAVSVVRADGTVGVDPKKVQAINIKANSDQFQAKQILAKSSATEAELKIAEKHLRDAITLRNSVWGYEDANIPKLLNQLGNTYERLKQQATAKTCYQNAIVYINKKYGTGSSERLDTLVNLAPILVKEGNLSEALSLQQQIALMKERKSGAADIGTIQARLNWAVTAKQLDKPNAPDIYKQCLVDIDKAGPNISADKVSKLKAEIIPSYIETLKKQGRQEEAQEATNLLGTAAAPVAAAPAVTPVTGPGAVPAVGATATPATSPSTNPAANVGAGPAASSTSQATPATAPPAIPEHGIKITPVSNSPSH